MGLRTFVVIGDESGRCIGREVYIIVDLDLVDE